ncbi:MAG: DNA polymerase I, partial [Fibrobacteres bacterium]|nr:DNA polymerase I [Fibrobacterota bacterium]
MNDLYLIDGMALAYRGHFAFIRNPLKNSKGFPTSALYSFLSVLRHFIDNEKAAEIAVVFDTDRETFRKEIYAEYKAHRPPMPDELKIQIPEIMKLLQLMRIPVLSMPGVEADDIIGTLAVKHAAAGGKAYIVSKDKDFGQLVNDNILLIDPKVQAGAVARIGADGVKEKFGVPPDRIIDYLALLGDASDNVPGVPRVGEKTAVELISKFGSLDDLYARLDEVEKKGLKKALEENKENAYLSRTLVTIKTDVELAQTEFPYGPEDGENYAAYLKEMDFNQFFKSSVAVQKKSAPAVEYRTIRTHIELSEYLNSISSAAAVGIDTETDGLDPLSAPLAGISLSAEEGKAVYIPVSHVEADNCPIESVRELLLPFLNRKDIVKAGHNLKFDLAVLNKHNLRIEPPFFDTMIAGYLLNPGSRQLGLDDLVLARYDIAMQQITELIGEKKAQQILFSQVPVASATPYAAADADMALRLMKAMKPELDSSGLAGLFLDVEMPLMTVLLSMEELGIKVDKPFLEQLSNDYDQKLIELQRDIFKEADAEFNLNSPKQLQEILFVKLGIKPTKKNKTGFSTDAEVLEELASQHPVPRLIMQHRKYQKLKSTYVDALPLWADKNDRVHSSFNQAIAATGRLSSSEPNLQNIPIRTDEGRELRKVFIPASDDHVLVSGDYSQIELRVLAHVANEKVLIEAFHEGEDIHKKTAALVFGMIPSMVTAEQRAMAKTVNFGIIYGQGAFSLSQQLGIARGEAQRFIDGYFATYPAIRTYMDNMIKFGRENGYVETVFKRRRPLPDILSKNHQDASFAERIAINTPIQGTAADLIKIAMVRIQKKIDSGLLKASLLLQVHDELVLECRKEDAETVTSIVKYEMEHAAELKVPLKVDIGSGH